MVLLFGIDLLFLTRKFMYVYRKISILTEQLENAKQEFPPGIYRKFVNFYSPFSREICPGASGKFMKYI